MTATELAPVDQAGADSDAHGSTSATEAAATPESRLVAREVSLSYGERTVLDQLSVEVPPGKVTAIVGANGCGKSTLLRGLARLLKPTSGSILLDGNDIHTRSTRDVARVVGLLPQSPLAP